jgi:hypothetical protein
VCLVATPVRPAAQESAASGPVALPADGNVVHEPSQFVGLWDYNAAESINILTGRPEQSPRSATQRSVGRTSQPPMRRGGGDGAGGGSLSPSTTRMGGAIGLTPAMVREQQYLQRDLLEVPEALTISVEPGKITFIDDLERERTYPTDGSKQKYQVGAARFDARLTWDDGQLRKHVEGAYGFKMSETYFLSSDGRRLFVIVRVGEPKRDEPQAGFNRVYDRIDRPAPN